MKVEQLGHPLDQGMKTGLQQTGLQKTGMQQQLQLGGGSESRRLERQEGKRGKQTVAGTTIVQWRMN